MMCKADDASLITTCTEDDVSSHITMGTTWNNAGGKARRDENLSRATEASNYLPAPEEEEGKLMIVGGVWYQRNNIPMLRSSSCYKPSSLSNLSNELFLNFTKDLELSMQSHWTNYWFIVAMMLSLPLLGAVVALFFLPSVFVSYYVAACLLLGSSFVAWGNHCQREDLQSEIEVRITEWQESFNDQGFAVRFIVDKIWWAPTEMYIHIYKRAAAGNQTLSLVRNTRQEEVKFSLAFSILFGRGNKTLRVIPNLEGLYVKPPQLTSLNDDIFQKLMGEMDTSVRAFRRKKRGLHCFLPSLICIPLLIWAPLVISSPISLGLCLLFALSDQLNFDHLPFSSRKPCIFKRIRKWTPRLKNCGFTITYRVEQPSWYSRKAGYIYIRHDAVGFEI